MAMDLEDLKWWADHLAPRRPAEIDEDEAPSADGEDDGWPAGLGLPPDAGRPERAGTREALTVGASATKAQRGAFAQLGLKAEDVAARMQRDAVGTTKDVVDRLERLPKGMQAAVSSDLFGDEARIAAATAGAGG